MLYYFIIENYLKRKLSVLPPEHLKLFEYGWGNGYLLVPKGHDFYEKDYDDLYKYNIDIHGGLTFSTHYKNFKAIRGDLEYKLDENLEKRVKEYGVDWLDHFWCIGFDTNHHGDNLITCSKDYVWEETKKLHKQGIDHSLSVQRKNKLKKLSKKR